MNSNKPKEGSMLKPMIVKRTRTIIKWGSRTAATIKSVGSENSNIRMPNASNLFHESSMPTMHKYT